VLSAILGAAHDQPLSILCLGAHSDDIEIGCGGTLLRLLAQRPGCSVRWVVFSADDAREAEARRSAASFLTGAGTARVDVHRHRESYFPYVGHEIKDEFEQLKALVAPDIVFSHRRDDAHQDHRVIAEFTWNTFRDHLIAEYEIPKFEGDLGHPNVYVPLDTQIADDKVALLIEHFGSQRSKGWFRPETFRAMMALRAIECNASTGWAEAFHVRKLVLEQRVRDGDR
jgi:LmbE family N-acetylglucosaminyl deacetylase